MGDDEISRRKGAELLRVWGRVQTGGAAQGRARGVGGRENLSARRISDDRSARRRASEPPHPACAIHGTPSCALLRCPANLRDGRKITLNE